MLRPSPSPPRLLTALWVLALLLPVDLGAQDEGPPRVEVRDSAGIRIVEHVSLDSATVAFSVGEEPIFRVGWGAGGRIFEDVRDVALFQDGRVVVADGGSTQELVVLGRDGRVQEVLGGRGEGPGEFENLDDVAVGDGDTIVAQEWWGELTVFGGGAVVETLRLSPYGNATILDYRDGALYMGAPLDMVRGRGYPDPWRAAPLLTIPLASLVPDTVREVAWEQSIDFAGSDPFAAHGLTEAVNGRFVAGRGDQPELRWYDRRGQLQQVARWSDPPGTVSEDLLATWEEEARRSMRDLPPGLIERSVGRQLDQHVGTIPYFGRLLTDHEGRVWIGEFETRGYTPPGPPGRRFFVFSPTGESLGIVHMPAESNFRLLAIGDDRVVGIERNPLDVEAIVAYPMESSLNHAGWEGSSPLRLLGPVASDRH